MWLRRPVPCWSTNDVNSSLSCGLWMGMRCALCCAILMCDLAHSSKSGKRDWLTSARAGTPPPPGSDVASKKNEFTTLRETNTKMQDVAGIDEKYKQTNKLLMDLRLEFEQLEAAGENSSLSLQETIQLNLTSLSRLLNSLEMECLPSQNSKRKEIWRMYSRSPLHNICTLHSLTLYH